MHLHPSADGEFVIVGDQRLTVDQARDLRAQLDRAIVEAAAHIPDRFAGLAPADVAGRLDYHQRKALRRAARGRGLTRTGSRWINASGLARYCPDRKTLTLTDRGRDVLAALDESD